MRITRAMLGGEGSAPPPMVAHRPTRYAIKHPDGRWLALGHRDRRVVPLWTHEEDQRWTWPTMTAAVMAALDVDQLDLPATGPWTVEPV